jgi:hypothetical protein
MPSIVLNKIAQPQQVSNVDLFASNTPLSYKDWIKNNIGLIPEDSKQQYERYLLEFYSKKTDENENHSERLKNDYKNLIKKLGVVFKNDKEFSRFSKINVDSPVELTLAIPYFSKKLKEIALYFSKKRKSLQYTKLQYASTGSETGLERFLYNKLLESLSQNIPLTDEDDIFLNDDTIRDLQKNLKIEIEELYEDHNYFEDGNKLEINPLLCVLDSLIFDFCEEDNFFTRSSVDPLQNEYLCVDNDFTIKKLVSEGWSLYNSSNLNYITGGEQTDNIFDVNLSFTEGNNFFYWFSGEAIQEIPDGVFGDVSLSSINWENATAGGSIDTADILFATYGNIKTEGAWLISADKITFVTTMTATMKDGKEFKFPYPGFGLSAEDGEWSGRLITDLTEDDKRFFPDEEAFQENRKNIENLYWSDITSISSIDDIYIQELRLWESGAFASLNFKTADKIIVRSNTGPDKLHDVFPNEIYQGKLDIAWLYKFNKTQIPIIKENSNIYFPLTSFENIDDLYFKYDENLNIPLSSIKVNGAFTGAIAGDDIENSDLIIKKNSFCGPELEAAWLEGTPLSSFRDDDANFCVCDKEKEFVTATDWIYTKGFAQPGVSFKVESNQIVKFVWTGPTTDINNIKGFNGFIHDDSCPYNTLNHEKSILDIDFKLENKEEAEKWKQCTCRSVYHCPIGQKTNNISDFNIIPDLILEEFDSNIPLNLNSWVGSDGKSYKTSKDASWFKLEKSVDKDVGWGEGQWVNSFQLKQGKTYWYYRTNLNRCDIDLPFFVINECYTEIITKCDQRSNIPVWKKAVKNSNGEWVKTDLISDMTLSYGTFYDYIHRPSHSWTKSRIKIDGDYVSSEDFITVNKQTDNYGFDSAIYNSSSVEFLIKIPLKNNRPYWGIGTYEFGVETKNKKILRNYDDNRLIGSYLISNQALPSDIILSDGDVIRYESYECNDCFIWLQPITMNVQKPIRQWNKILFSDCVKSEILDYLHDNCYGDCNTEQSLCDCNNLCSSFKTGVTATNEPSDMMFNVDLSGVPLFINYYARQPLNITVQIHDLLNPLITPILSGVLIEPQYPWRNLINDEVATFVSNQEDSFLKNKHQLGIFTPEKIAMGKYELHNADIEKGENMSFIFRDNNYFDGPFKPINIDSSWMKTETGLPLINGHQTYYPYQSDYNLGLYNNDYPLSPWSLEQLPIGCLTDDYFTSIRNITGNIVHWTTDIYGNQFFLNSDDTKILFSNTGKLLIKEGSAINFAKDSLSGIFYGYDFEEIKELNMIRNFEIFYDTLHIVHSLSSNDFITINKLVWDYDDQKYTNSFEGYGISLNSEELFIDWILQDSKKNTYIFILDNSDDIQKIYYYEYNLNQNKLKKMNILPDDEWVSFGVFDTNQKPILSYFEDIVYILFGTIDKIHILSFKITNNIDFIGGQTYSKNSNIYVRDINHNNDGMFLLLNDSTQIFITKLQ